MERLPAVLEMIRELTHKAADGSYIYRGEPECYPLVSSKLYREYDQIEVPSFNIEIVQQEILEKAQKFIRQVDEDDILTQLQHYGYPTNLIDFTTNYTIALFFACYSEQDKDGRVILLDKAFYQSLLKEPMNPENRIIAQNSVFVQSPSGFVEPSNTVIIPQDLKVSIMEYLDKYHGVNAATVFNDIHGFIRYQSVHESAYAKTLGYVDGVAGLTHMRRGEYEEAIDRFSKAIEINPQLSVVHYNRGLAYQRQGDDDLAIQDYDRAIELNPNYALAYYNRGLMYRQQDNLDRAIQNYDRAIELNPNYARAYYNRGLAYSRKGNLDRAIQKL